jgi:hypothetical protein
MYDIKGHGGFVVRDSARKLGVSDGDMCHAVAHAMVRVDRPPGGTLHLGPERAGRLHEVVSVREGGDVHRVIHAIPMRRGYERHLREVRGDAR